MSDDEILFSVIMSFHTVALVFSHVLEPKKGGKLTDVTDFVVCTIGFEQLNI